MNLLEEIFRQKRADLPGEKTRVPRARLEAIIRASPPPLPFAASLVDLARPAPRLIAEVKRRSPSKGVLGDEINPVSLAALYAQKGAAAISILTESHFFDGSLLDLEAVAESRLPCPLLRKDFLFDAYHLLEARAAGASAVLLIAAALPPQLLADLIDEARRLDLCPLVEVHGEMDLDDALAAGANVIGVNNRDLTTFDVDISASYALRPRIPDGCIAVSESGIRSRTDAQALGQAGFDAVLVGEALMTAGHRTGEAVRELSGLPEAVTGRSFP